MSFAGLLCQFTLYCKAHCQPPCSGRHLWPRQHTIAFRQAPLRPSCRRHNQQPRNTLYPKTTYAVKPAYINFALQSLLIMKYQ